MGIPFDTALLSTKDQSVCVSHAMIDGIAQKTVEHLHVPRKVFAAQDHPSSVARQQQNILFAW